MRLLLVLLFLMHHLQVSLIVGRLTILRGKEQIRSFTHSNRKLLCVSDDDDGGLIWNSNLNWLYSSYEFSDRGGNTDFQRINTYRKGEIDCDLNSHDSCMSAWNTTWWNLTNSKETPMGPVLDRRWEEFREYNNFGTTNEYRLIDTLRRSGAFVVSVRGSTDGHVLLCDSDDYETDFCYWIIIGGWSNTESVIRKCAKGVPDPMSYPIEPTCAQIRASYFYETLSPTEWKTFILKWNNSTKTISVYDTQKLLMTYTDNEDRPRDTNRDFYLFLRSSKTMLLRFHIYSFLRTTNPLAILASPVFNLTTTNLCVQMTVGLCAECQMEVVLVDPANESNEESLKMIKGSMMVAAHGLATWQHVRIDKTIASDFRKSVQIRLIPGLERKSANPLWAVANVRMCPPVGTVRYGSMEATQDYANNEYFWPNVTCQKLFYNENVVVNSVADATFDLEFDDLHCPEGRIGPYCSISCYEHLENNADCRGTVICEGTSCTCPPGFVGKDCHLNCYINQYGHGCKQTCGWCRMDTCNFKTGQCTAGCDNSRRFNIPPFCKIGIDVLPPPDIDFINETVVRALLPVREEYKLVPSSYRFVIQKEGEFNHRPIGDYTKILNSTVMMIGYNDHLESGISYRISCILYIYNNFLSVRGEWKNFTTRCTPSTNFNVEISNTSLTLKKDQKEELPYSCPDQWYDLVFRNHQTNVNIIKGTLPKLPYEFTNLTPCTFYVITISKGTASLFSKEIRTHEGVPSQVRHVRKITSPNGDVTLQWDPPLQPNGIVSKYEVVLQVQTYIGCDNLKIHSPENHTISISTPFNSIVFSDLIPYARYVAKIAAYTSYRGPEGEIEFSTNQTEIPAEVYSNFRIQDYTLMWDPPEDCTTISGPIVAKLVINGVSKAVSNVSITKQTTKYSIDLNHTLYGAETYEARIYAIRGYHKEQNELLYARLVFTTPSKVPPPVRNLQIFEIDARSMKVHLRWQAPEPPINGEIQYYVVSSCQTNCEVVSKVRPTEHCDLWNKYICSIVKRFHQQSQSITVAAVNVNVSTPSVALSVPIVRDEIRPDAPEIFIVVALDKGIVNLTWSHPWRTGGRLKKFSISVEMISTRLRMHVQRSQTGMLYEHRVKDYRSWYKEQLYLLSSTAYKISVSAVTNTDVYGEIKVAEVRTPLAMKFEKELRSEVDDATSTISLHIPAVLNDTTNSVTSVVVKGPQPCEHYANPSPYVNEKAGIANHGIAWRVATFSTDKFAGGTFTIGDNKVYEGAKNCPLKPEESYVIMVIVQTEEGSMDDQTMVAQTTSIRIGDASRRHEAWFIPVAIFLVVGTVAFCFYRRKRKRSMKHITLREEMALARNSENLEGRSISSNSRQVLTGTSTPPDKTFLSRASTPIDDTGIFVNDNDQKEERTCLVKVKDFEEYVKQAIDSGSLHRQYNMLPRGQTRPWKSGKLPKNKPKNRYGNLIAYDENRVVLKSLPNDPCSDYINASYIKGYKNEKCYIATQGPKANTVIDFWRMIWQEETLIVCMLTNLIEGGKTKCEQYWPDIGKKKKYGDVTVFNARHTVFADFTFRTLHVSCGDEARKIEHLHYTAWPDHDVPLSTHSVVTYLKKLLATPPGSGPIAVHCSAGAGRTGTVILCDICLRRAAAEGMIDVFAETESIRSQRANMVYNAEQYLLAHLTLVECLFSVPTSLPCNDSLPTRIKELKKQLLIQWNSLEKMMWQDQALRPPSSQVSLSERNLAKHRFPELASVNIARVYLKRYPPTDEESDYISAVYVDGVRLQNQYIATQLPLPGTFSDFWRMVAEYKVELMVVLQPPDPKDTTSCPIVPSKEFKPVPYINVRTKEFVEYESYTAQKLILVDNLEKPVTEQQVTILCSVGWKSGRNEDPPETMTLVTLWQAAERISRGDGPTAVLCHDGVTGCGLYLALSFLLERMAVERECDVCLAIRAVRRSRPDFVKSLEHMKYLYDAAVTYLKYFETYANFT